MQIDLDKTSALNVTVRVVLVRVVCPTSNFSVSGQKIVQNDALTEIGQF